MIALKTVFDRSLADGRDSEVEIVLGEDRFRARVGGGELDVVRAAAERPDAKIATDPATLAAVLWHGRPINDAAIEVQGDRQAAERFLRLFPAPEPATG
jgi:ubiquinone biosynthesis protein UbiJ